MKRSIPRQFADLTAKLEDLHSLAVEGQGSENSPDMHRVLAAHLRTGLASLETALAKVAGELGDQQP